VPAEGGCTFVLTDAFSELGKAARDAAGWHTCLDFLAEHVAGAITDQDDETARSLLIDIQVGVRAHQQALSEL